MDVKKISCQDGLLSVQRRSTKLEGCKKLLEEISSLISSCFCFFI